MEVLGAGCWELGLRLRAMGTWAGRWAGSGMTRRALGVGAACQLGRGVRWPGHQDRCRGATPWWPARGARPSLGSCGRDEGGEAGRAEWSAAAGSGLGGCVACRTGLQGTGWGKCLAGVAEPMLTLTGSPWHSGKGPAPACLCLVLLLV